MKLKAIFYLILASLCFGISPVAIKYLINLEIDSIEIILASALLLVLITFLYLITKKDKLKEISKKNWKDILIIAILATGVGSAGLTYAQQYTLAINLAFLMKLSVVFVPIIAFLVVKEKHSIWKYGVMLFAFFGAFLLTTSGKIMIPNIGDIMVIGIAVILSYTNVLAKKVSYDVDAFLISAIRIFVGSLLLLFLIFIVGITFTFLFTDYFYYIILISGCTLGTIFFLYKGIQLSTASEATTFFLLSAPISFILSYIFLNEVLTFTQFSGGILILVSCYLLRK